MKLSVLSVVAASLCSAFSAAASTAPALAARLPLVLAAQAETTPAGDKPAQPAQPDAPKPAPAQPAGEQPQTEEKLVYVKMSVSIAGAAQPDVFLELNKEKAPISVENFVKYVEKGYYDGTIFHRVIPKFMVQGGGFDETVKEKTTGREKPIKNEWKNGLKNVRGAVAMARTQVADSATSQFFINTVDHSFLDTPRDGAAYAVFGKVVAGMATVDKIEALKTGMRGGMPDVPLENAVMTKVVKISAEDAQKAIEAEKAGASSGGETKK